MANNTSLAAKAGKIKLGSLSVNRLGLGTNRISDTAESRELLLKAVELGIDFIDTAHRYSGGASETMIGTTLAPYPDGLVIASKGGVGPDGPSGSYEALKQDLEESLKRLKTDCIELYQLHRVDPKVPIEESVRFLKIFQEEGKIRYIGLSEVNLDELERAERVADIVSVQNQYNVVVREYEDLVDYCTEHSIAFIPWFPLGGLRGGAQEVDSKLADLAKKYNASSQQIALAWLLKRSPMILPIPGTLSIEHLEDNLNSAKIELSDADYGHLTNI